MSWINLAFYLAYYVNKHSVFLTSKFNDKSNELIYISGKHFIIR